MASTVAAQAASSRSSTATANPSRLSRCDTAAPMPRAAPVTMATRCSVLFIGDLSKADGDTWEDSGMHQATDRRFIEAPKALLHDHLDGGVRAETILDISDAGRPRASGEHRSRARPVVHRRCELRAASSATSMVEAFWLLISIYGLIKFAARPRAKESR